MLILLFYWQLYFFYYLLQLNEFLSGVNHFINLWIHHLFVLAIHSIVIFFIILLLLTASIVFYKGFYFSYLVFFVNSLC